MTSCTEKSWPISPITGEEIGKPSIDYDYIKTMENFSSLNNQKSTLVRQNYLSIDEEELLEKKVEQFLTTKMANEKNTTDEYHDQYCVCPDCTYQRNLAKPSHSLFNMTMRTIYKQSFKNNSPKASSVSKFEKKAVQTFNGKQINQKESSIYPKDKVELETIYKTEMNKGIAKERTNSLKNDDSLRFNGPFQNTTTYSTKFPGVSGGNPYVKPIQKAVRQKFKLDAKTMNSTFYKGQFTERSALARSKDNFKTGLPSLCKESTSHKFYDAPSNPEDYNKHYRSVEKRVHSPNDKHQFESTYRNSFYGPNILEMVRHKKRLIRETLSRLGM